MKDKKIMFYECDFDNAEVCIESTGEWIKLADFSDWNELVEACGGEDNLRFSDYHDIPTAMIGATWIDPEIYEVMDAVSECANPHALLAYVDYFFPPLMERSIRQTVMERVRNFDKAFLGEFYSEEAFAEFWAIFTKVCSEDDWAYKYINWERVAFGLFVNDYLFINVETDNGYVGCVYNKRI